MRGKGQSMKTHEAEARITPAWAGKSRSSLGFMPSQTDHPRMGGEKAAYLAGLTSGVGSPPRGRGKAEVAEYPHYIDRITPAWAGKRAQPACPGIPGQDHPRVGGEKSHSSRCWSRPADHPRVGGEKSLSTSASIRRLGSPPRGQGKECDKPYLLFWIGITPAWAGKRSPMRPSAP